MDHPALSAPYCMEAILIEASSSHSYFSLSFSLSLSLSCLVFEKHKEREWLYMVSSLENFRAIGEENLKHTRKVIHGKV